MPVTGRAAANHKDVSPCQQLIEAPFDCGDIARKRRLPVQHFIADTPDRSERTTRVKSQFSLKSLLIICVTMAIVAAVVAPLVGRISFGSGAIITWESDDGAIELVGVGPTLHGLVALVLLIAFSVFGLAFVVYRRRKAMRR